MRRFLQWSRAALIGLMFAAGLATVGLLFPVLRCLPLLPARRLEGAIQVAWYSALLSILGVNVRVTGRPCPDAALWVSNHVSWLDIVLLGTCRPLTFVAKSEVGTWPLVGFLAKGTGTLLVRRGDLASSGLVADRMTWLLRQGQAVALFPEGTSSTGAAVMRFHARLFGPAVRVGARVQPVAIRYHGAGREHVPFVGDDDFLPHLWRLLGERRIAVELSFCPPVTASGKARDELAAQTRSHVVSALGGDSAEHLVHGLRRNRN
ncbi:lysophospholipid acyltransferase family protein [Methylolobus aquaticus]